MPVAGITAKGLISLGLFVGEFALGVAASSNVADFVVCF